MKGMCLECKEEIQGKWAKKFCGSSCAAKYNNRKRGQTGWKHCSDSKDQISASVKTKVKLNPKVRFGNKFIPDMRFNTLCKYCNRSYLESMLKPKGWCKCKSCPKFGQHKYKGCVKVNGVFVLDQKTSKFCPYCNKEFKDSIYRPLYYCRSSSCIKKHITATRRRTKRSKAEIYLQELLSSIFEHVEGGNRSILEGREIDIVLRNHLIAIEWDGSFHRKPIFGKRMFKFIQRNDALKTKCLLNLGWCIIRVKDQHNGTAPKKYVKQKFKEIVELINKGFIGEIII